MMWTSIKKKKEYETVWKFERNPHRTFSKVAAWNVLITWALQPAGQRVLVHKIWNNIAFFFLLTATLIFFIPSNLFFSGFVCGKNNIAAFNVEILFGSFLYLFGSFPGSSPCFPHLPATAQPLVLVRNQGNKFMRGQKCSDNRGRLFSFTFSSSGLLLLLPFHHRELWDLFSSTGTMLLCETPLIEMDKGLGKFFWEHKLQKELTLL